MSVVGTSFLVLVPFAAADWREPSIARRAGHALPHEDPGAKCALAEGKDTKGDNAEKKSRPKFTIGKETTYVTGPRDEDGYIDYAAALNKRLRQGVTPANNANVLLWTALGPHPEGAAMPPDFFQWLGIQAPLERGAYFIDLFPYIKDHLKVEPREDDDEIFQQLDRCTQRPWTAKEHPDMASWLKANEKPLALVVDAAKRSRYFSPLVPSKAKKGSSGLIGALLPGVQKSRGLANALAARAMLRVGEGAYHKAWQDLLACHRLGRLVARGGTLIEGLVGIAIDNVASKADLAFLERSKPNAKRIENCLRDLQRLPPFPETADKVDLGERFFFLDNVMMMDRYGIQHLENLSDGGGSKGSNPLADRALTGIDWDPALQTANRWYDRLAAAMREKDRRSRQKKLDQIEADLRALKKKIVAGEMAKLLRGGNKATSKLLGDILISLLVPALSKVQTAGDRAKQTQNNLEVAFALAWYQRDHGRYPKNLDALAPKYLGQIPQDVFSGKALIYRPSGNGYLLYSVGVNGKDD
ncbi:MAG TPA: hypothetical protein VG013_13660, partial [Gemmataceae bacterium]|nr:hypothetical protein [Gemmataceae bacterium]